MIKIPFIFSRYSLDDGKPHRHRLLIVNKINADTVERRRRTAAYQLTTKTQSIAQPAVNTKHDD
jgi:hypothetical protein